MLDEFVGRVGHIIGEQARAKRRALPRARHELLVGDGQAPQGRGAGDVIVQGVGTQPRAVGRDDRQGAELRVEPCNAFQVVVNEFPRGDPAGVQPLPLLESAQMMEFEHVPEPTRRPGYRFGNERDAPAPPAASGHSEVDSDC